MLLTNITRPVIFFDGECNLCNSAVQYVIRHDKKEQFLFAPLQSDAGRQVLQLIPGNIPDSFILYHNGKIYIKSSAALQTARLLGGWRTGLYAFIVIPRLLRDAVYNLVARNRYRWFGRRDSCMVPTEELKARFLTPNP